ncbi:MAG: hypothetical protein P1Q69_08840 [Candidatus Thorarchaeota archaeon]|nr:hypothetical protein [Candidatus Thorarchaeota archaeon]
MDLQGKPEITIFFSSKTIGGGHMGRKGLQPDCHPCEKALGIGNKDHKLVAFIPAEAMPLIFSAELAAKQLGIKLKVVDVNQIAFLERLKFILCGRSVPCMKIGNEFIIGILTKDEIIEHYLSTFNNT